MLVQNFFKFFYFSIYNSIFIIVFCIFYLFPKIWLTNSNISYSITEYIIAIAYTFCSHFSLISLCFLTINATTLASIFIRNRFRIFIQAALVSTVICYLIIDIYVYHVDGVHLTDFFSANIPNLFINDLSPLFSISRIRSVIITWLILCFFKYKVAAKIEESNWFAQKKIGRKFICLFFITLLFSQLAYFYVDNNHKIFYFAKYLLFQHKNNLFLQDTNPEIKYLIESKLYKTNYPLAPLSIDHVKSPKNIIIIAADAWRADYFNAESSPNLWKFAQQGTIFTNHFSGANATRHGLFSLFYGIPASHWHVFSQNQQYPVFMDRLQQLDYQIGVFISTQVKRDQLDKTIFSNISNLRLNSIGNTPVELDRNTTDDWIKWYKNRDKSKNFFSFIFYYSIHEHDFPESYADKYLPTNGKIKYDRLAKIQGNTGFKDSYKISVMYVDNLASEILATLSDQNDLENTIVIITSDHGHQLNDNQQKIWGHGSNFTKYQLKVPFAIVGSKFNTQSTINDLTTHYDFVATIMPNFLGVTNDVLDYSIGRNLLEKNDSQNWYIASTCLETLANSMLSFGIIDQNKCLKIFPSGKYQLISNDNKLIPKAIDTNYNHIEKVITNMFRFLK